MDLAATTAGGNEIGNDRLFQIENIIGGQSNDTIRGNGAANRLDGHTGSDTMEGRGGNDTYVVDRLTDIVIEQAGGGTDTIIAMVNGLTLTSEVEHMVLGGAVARGVGNARDNRMSGNGTANRLEGESGNDTLDGGAGNDTMIGGAGNDTYVVDVEGDQVFETTTSASTVDAGGIDKVQSAVTFSLDANAGVRFVERLTLTGTGAINGTGNALANTLTGNAGNNVLMGGLGIDTLIGGAGNDTYLTDGTDIIIESRTGGTDEVRSAVSITLSRNIEILTLTGNAAVDGTGNASANLITGNAKANRLNGGFGDDTLIGGAGNDTYVVDAAGDQVFETTTTASTVDAGGVDTVQSELSFSLDANAGVRFVERLTLTGTANVNGTGNAMSNLLTGNAGNNVLNGGAGNDTMIGGAGNDTYVVDVEGDQVFETTTSASTVDAGGIDKVQSAVTFSLDANAGVRFVERLTLTGSGAINGTGNALANTLTGNAASNVLNGGASNDTLNGGAGNDSLFGGTGSDVFVFSGAFGIDVITGFDLSAVGEVVDLSELPSITNFADLVTNHLTQVGADSVIRAGANTITLTGVIAGSLLADDFLF